MSAEAVPTPLDWRAQAQVHLERASEANAKGHAGTWSREMQLAELCMEQERRLIQTVLDRSRAEVQGALL